MRTVSRCSPNTRAASRVLIPSTMQARRTRAYNSTLYILYTFHGLSLNPMKGRRRSSFQPPFTRGRSALVVHFTSAFYIRPMAIGALLSGTFFLHLLG